MDNNTPCKDCEIRHMGCHSSCEEYKHWKYEWDRINEISRNKRRIEFALTDSKIRQCEKMRKKKMRR